MGKMDPERFQDMVASVEQIGFTDPVVHLYDGKILDGSHRYEVAKTLGRVRELDSRTLEGDPLAFVIAQNRARRQPDPCAGGRSYCRLPGVGRDGATQNAGTGFRLFRR